MYEWRFYGGANGYTVIEHHAPAIVDANDGFKIFKDSEVYLFDDANAFKWILSNWCTNKKVDFRIYAVFAAHYHGGLPPSAAEPNEPTIITDPNILDNNIPDPNILPDRLTGYILPGSKTLHLYRDCRYIYWKEVLNVNIVDELIGGMSICESCAKREE